MTRINAKPRGVVAKARARKARWRLKAYKAICMLVDVRDDGRCRYCGSICNLEHHHLRARSLGREDTTANILLLCHKHHEDVGTRVGGRKLWIRALTDKGADGPLHFIGDEVAAHASGRRA